jgi:hypothetical protein
VSQEPANKWKPLMFGLTLVLLVSGLWFGTSASGASGASKATSLGTWINMPANATEFMGNTSYRGLIVASVGVTINVKLAVNCIIPSKTAGAKLQLQYANFSDSTHTNITNFVSISNMIVSIDNSPGSPCPGTINNSLSFSLPLQTVNPSDYWFRVIGSGGGGLGDNPRFSSVSVIASVVFNRYASAIVSSSSSTSFTTLIDVTLPLASATTENFFWIASNSTNLTCTVGSCIEEGSNSCSIAIGATQCAVVTTFATAFTGTPSVVAVSKNARTLQELPSGSINLMSAQTLTV